ncbi:MAG: hypothetical protein Ct9H90mP5_11550 [Acidimicrobiaceae bacterium]|nr:MAG: hypothetical protein Ct9H90mP5_11550 [Acidimicrobiaceae bacterium]
MEAGAATQVWASVTKDFSENNGAYLGDCQLGVEGGNPSESGYLPYIFNRDTAKGAVVPKRGASETRVS